VGKNDCASILTRCRREKKSKIRGSALSHGSAAAAFGPRRKSEDRGKGDVPAKKIPFFKPSKGNSRTYGIRRLTTAAQSESRAVVS